MLHNTKIYGIINRLCRALPQKRMRSPRPLPHSAGAPGSGKSPSPMSLLPHSSSDIPALGTTGSTATLSPAFPAGPGAAEMRATATRIVQRLQSAGHTAYFAGGCVRDQLLGVEAKDFDIATSARP